MAVNRLSNSSTASYWPSTISAGGLWKADPYFPMLANDHQALASLFGLASPVISASRFGNGLINDTYLVETAPNDDSSNRRFILQRINHGVFKNPHALMANIERVCTHLAGIEEGGEQSARVLELLPSVDGPSFVPYPSSPTEPTGYWRLFHYIENCVSHDTVANPEIAYEAARAFGRFQRHLDDMPGPRLYETIPGFHDTPGRLASLHDAIQEDRFDRARLCKEEIRFALHRSHFASRLLDLHRNGLIPERITHNDTKVSNVLIDRRSGQSVCVVDLDTVMPGLSLYDFGDLVRTCVSPAAEDSTDLESIQVRPEFFEALATGFLDEMHGILTSHEIDHLAFSGVLLTYEVGIRFLTDFLRGDTYFSILHSDHNLVRTRNQFRLVLELENELTPLQRIACQPNRRGGSGREVT
jgi:hypothetical protein